MSTLISVAPMMDCTDRHDRYFLRLIAPDIMLYTEMITAQALHYGDVNHLLSFHPSEKKLALQLGGSDAKKLALGAKLGESFGYDEINLNVGCPSPRVSKGRFGACLMLEPHLVADCVAEMAAQVNIPVTVKCRIGVDENDSYEALFHFVELISKAGCKTFIIHARKAWLAGLSPKENRELPPLHYDVVWKIKKDFPHLNIIINGGIKTLSAIESQLTHVDGVMIGRAAYYQPYFLAGIQANYFPNTPILTRHEVVQHYLPYLEEQIKNKIKLSSMVRHILGLFHGERGAALWRRHLSENTHLSNNNINVIKQALALTGT